ncbi:MAG: D-glycero-beta-D-manno-heptose-7-phosphate kinase [Proteobacteria bacterium]|nr:D-glycero-beta-D-manno-heptose-7-phosphate kinase [Pseudomonadota bacterium]MDE3208906.1 D-glycero-beta-D-manno-heptose-7-phosphate kinase [Pseudomonadota bacterium]
MLNDLFARLSQVRVLVVGDVMLDRYWFGEVSRISPEAPVPVVHVHQVDERAGGAANVARNIAALGGSVSLLSVVGEDEAGLTLERLLKADGVESRLHRDEAIDTTIKLRVVGRQQQLLRIDFEKKPSTESLDRKLCDFHELIQEADLVILSDYGKGALAHVQDMILACNQLGTPVLVDPKGDEYECYRNATMLTPNRSELREVCGRWKNESDLESRAQALRERLNLQALLVTRSEEGMTLFSGSGMVHEAARAREVFDVSGAGDTVIGTLGLMLACGATMEEAVRLANRAAGVVVGKFGTAVLSREELWAATMLECD